MPTVRFEPSGLSLEIDETTTLREAAHEAGVNVFDKCGGMGACCNCVITILSGHQHVNPKNQLEAAVFYLAENHRLSCQCRITGDVVIQPAGAEGF